MMQALIFHKISKLKCNLLIPRFIKTNFYSDKHSLIGLLFQKLISGK